MSTSVDAPMKKPCLRDGRRGLSLLELLIAMAILSVLAAAIIPMAEVTVKRTKELELHRALRTIRMAIDEYKDDFDKAEKEKKYIPTLGESGYPEDLEVLVKGNDWNGLYPYARKYLRRIPTDPFDEFEQGWGLRSIKDEADSTVWGGDDVFDVYSQSDGTGLDGTPYREW